MDWLIGIIIGVIITYIGIKLTNRMTRRIGESTIKCIKESTTRYIEAMRRTMTKQEEIREVLTTLGCKCKAKDLAKSSTGFDSEVDEAMAELDKLGVVIKVGREMPYKKCKTCGGRGTYIIRLPDDVGSPNVVGCDKCNGTGNSNTDYVAVGPLVKEG